MKYPLSNFQSTINYVKSGYPKFIFVLYFLLICIFSHSQESGKWITVSSNPVRASFNESFLQVEYKFKPLFACGISLGVVYPNENYEVFALSPSQNNFPGLVYHGIAIRSNYSFTPIHRNCYEFYISPQLMYKYLWYNGQQFHDSFGGKGRDHNYYTRDEKTNLYGFDLLIGWNFFPGMEKWKVNPYINLHLGVGFRYRYRDINNTESIVEGAPDRIVRVGEETKEQSYIIPLNGMRLGLRIKLN